MLSVKTWKSAGAAAGYYSKEAKHEYYAGKQQDSGRWRAIEVFGVADNSRVDLKGFERVLEGRHPVTGENLVSNAGEKHRPGYDLCFSAPKSVSVLWGLGDEQTQGKVFAAHKQAVLKAQEHIETHALFARRGKGGKVIEAVKNGIWAQFDHAVSRANDPQLHTHSLLANLAQRQDGSWGSIESIYTFREKAAAGAVYRAELALELQKTLGVEIITSGKSFEVRGVPESLSKEFSKRRNEILEQVSKTGSQKNIACLATRHKKTDTELETLREQWQQTGRKHGFSQKKVLDKGMRIRSDDNVIDKAMLELTSTRAVFNEHQLRAAIATEAQGIAGADRIQKLSSEAFKRSELLELSNNGKIKTYTTLEIFQLETSMQKQALERSGEQQHVIKATAVESQLLDSGLREEQQNMVRAITQETGGIKIALGGAGTGKSYALGVAKDIWEKQGFHCVGLAPTGKAASKLEESSRIKSQTVDLLLHTKQELGPKDIIVLDEAGMMGSRKLKELMDRAFEAKAKIVLVGDDKQLQAIEAGSTVRMLREKIGASSLTTSQRQKALWQREATQLIGEGKAREALDIYHKHGNVHIYSDKHVSQKLIDKWFSDSVTAPHKSRIIITSTNREVDELNQAARLKLKEFNKLTGGEIVETKHKDLEFCQGDRILFNRNSYKIGVTNGSIGTVKSIKKEGDGHSFIVKTDQKRLISFHSKDYNDFDHAYAVTVYKSQGDTLDQSYTLIGSQANRESSYVLLSRHRDSTDIFIDRSQFAGDLPSSKTKQSISQIFQDTLDKASNKMAQKQVKENALDYAKEIAAKLKEREASKEQQPSKQTEQVRSRSQQQGMELGF